MSKVSKTRSVEKSETMEHILFEFGKCEAERKNWIKKLKRAKNQFCRNVETKFIKRGIPNATLISEGSKSPEQDIFFINL